MACLPALIIPAPPPAGGLGSPMGEEMGGQGQDGHQDTSEEGADRPSPPSLFALASCFTYVLFF